MQSLQTKTFPEKTDWIFKAGICFKCLSGDHQANVCERKIRCGICGDNGHLSLLHKEKLHSTQIDSEAVNARCTSVCNINGGVSCSKILLVDVLSKITTDSPHRVYAIIDEQSNTSLISSELETNWVQMVQEKSTTFRLAPANTKQSTDAGSQVFIFAH